MQTEQIVLSEPAIDPTLLAPLEAVRPHLILAFAAAEFLEQPGFFQTLRQSFPEAELAGCSTSGEISAQGVMEQSCVLTGLRFDGGTQIRAALAHIPQMETSRAAGTSLGKELAAPDLRGVLVFAKGVQVNGSAIIEGLVEQIGSGIPVTGGLAGDGTAFRRTLTLTSSGVFADAAVAVGLYGDNLILAHGSYGGWVAFGPARKVTRCQGNILHELDGEPALNIYKRYLGDYAQDLPASGLLFPFEMLNKEHTTVGLIRTILGVDEEGGSLILAGDIDPSGYLRLMHASTNNLVDGAEAAAARTLAHLPEDMPPGLALLVSCVGRRLVMGDQVDDEVEAVADTLGRENTLAGFYSYGEISPYSDTTDCKLHNQTMTVTFLGEAY